MTGNVENFGREAMFVAGILELGISNVGTDVVVDMFVSADVVLYGR